MRGLGIIIGYILGNKAAREWCFNKICQASFIIDKEVKKTPLVKLFEVKEKNNEGKNECDKGQSPIKDKR